MIRSVYKVIKQLILDTTRRFKKIVPCYIPLLFSDLLDGKTALITGATSGIGKAIAIAFLRSKASVILTGRNQEKLDTLKKDLELLNDGKYKDKFEIALFDVSNIAEIEKQFSKIIKETKFHLIDILVNNAGINYGFEFGKTVKADFEKIVATNFEGLYFLSQCVAHYMKDNKIQGNILNILSSSSNRPAISAYACSKWAAKALTLGMAKSLIPYGIVVNGLAPGPTSTPMLIKDGYDGIELKQSPAGRYASAEEIANMAVILTSSLGRMLVGDTVMMTGGAGVITFDDIPYHFE